MSDAVILRSGQRQHRHSLFAPAVTAHARKVPSTTSTGAARYRPRRCSAAPNAVKAQAVIDRRLEGDGFVTGKVPRLLGWDYEPPKLSPGG